MSYRGEEEGVPAGRPKLTLQPRSQNASSAAASSNPSKPNPFGAARPRETIIAEREGKSESELLKELAAKEWKPNIVLTDAQKEEQKAAEGELNFAKRELEKEVDPVKIKALREEVSQKQKQLEELLLSFEKLVVSQAVAGGGKRPSERRRESEGQERADGFGGQGAGRSFGGFRERDDRQSYGDTWSGSRSKVSGGQCYQCGETGHFSRDCPSAPAGARGPGGGRSGGRPCYNCGEEGHISRECPQPSSGYSRGGGSYGGSYGSGYDRSGGGGGGYDRAGYGAAGGGTPSYGAGGYAEAGGYGGANGASGYARDEYAPRDYGSSGYTARGSTDYSAPRSGSGGAGDYPGLGAARDSGTRDYARGSDYGRNY